MPVAIQAKRERRGEISSQLRFYMLCCDGLLPGAICFQLSKNDPEAS